MNKNFIKCKSERKEDYVDLVSTNISNVLNVLDTIKPDINNLVNGFSSVLLDAAKDTFGIYKTRNVDGNKLLNTHKTWFSKTCENKRKNFTKPEQNIIKTKIIIHVEIWKFMQKSTGGLCKKTIENLMIALQTSWDKRQHLILGNFGIFWIDIVSLELIQKLFSSLPLKSSLCQIIVIFNIFLHIYYNEINLIMGIE